MDTDKMPGIQNLSAFNSISIYLAADYRPGPQHQSHSVKFSIG
jgi:hypothetical protein